MQPVGQKGRLGALSVFKEEQVEDFRLRAGERRRGKEVHVNQRGTHKEVSPAVGRVADPRFGGVLAPDFQFFDVHGGRPIRFGIRIIQI